LKEEQGDDPYIEDDPPLRYPVSFDQLVLICMDKISNEEDEEDAQDLWQVMIAVDIVWSWTDVECVLTISLQMTNGQSK
jgi:hypothetical protein